MHYGIVSPPVPGHLHPFGALGRELISRGHRVTLLQMADVEAFARAEGLEFAMLGQSDHPFGSLPASLRRLGDLKGSAALRFTVRQVARTSEMICRDAPDAVHCAGIQALLVDQTEPAGGTVAERLGLPFVTICNALALNRDPAVPPPFSSWAAGGERWRQLRNRLGYAASDLVLRPVTGTVAKWRARWRLPAHASSESAFSSLAQISQQPPAFDYPRPALPPAFHYVGPLRRPAAHKVPFPWEKIDGRPLIYASLGTLQKSPHIFCCFAEACASLGVQLVITHANSLDERTIQGLPGDPLVVGYAPQLDVLARASLTLTHAGLNTVLDSLSHGVPLVAIPLTYEQPAIAARLRFTGAGVSLPLSSLRASALRERIVAVLGDPAYARNAARLRDSVRAAGGVTRAADIIESVTRA